MYSCPGPVKTIVCLHCPKTVAEKLSTPLCHLGLMDLEGTKAVISNPCANR